MQMKRSPCVARRSSASPKSLEDPAAPRTAPAEAGDWHRSLFNRELRSPLTHPRPGEDPDGTFHAYQSYDQAPTVREICDFAAVDFSTPTGLEVTAVYLGSCERLPGFE